MMVTSSFIQEEGRFFSFATSWIACWMVLLVTVPRTVLDATASVLTRLGNAAAQLVLRTQPRRAALRTASVRQDQRKYFVLRFASAGSQGSTGNETAGRTFTQGIRE